MFIGFWVVFPKKGDELNLSKKHCKNFKTFIFGNSYKEFKMIIKNKITSQAFYIFKRYIKCNIF